jgi:hypothetical protein
MMKHAIEFGNFVLDSFMDFVSIKHTLTENVELSFTARSEFTGHLETGPYLDDSIVKGIKQHIKYCFSSHFVVKDVSVNFEYWDGVRNAKRARFFLEYTMFLIHLLERFNPQQRSLTLVLIDYDARKQLPMDGSVLTSEHVNSGLTMMYSSSHAKVIVYRREEMIKVLTHEMIHFMNIDAKHISPSDESWLTNAFCLTKSVNMNEAFTDAFACTLNIVMYTILSSNTDRDFAGRLKANIQKEVKYIKGQARRVLEHVDFKDNTCEHYITEHTHAISYFVVKAILLHDVSSFCRFLQENNYMLKDINALGELLRRNIEDINWKTFGKKEFNGMKNINTLRMSSLDIINFLPTNKTI